MNTHPPGFRRVFVWLTRAWNHRPEDKRMIAFGLLNAEGKLCARMFMEWDKDGAPILKVGDSDWTLMPLFRGLYSRMAKVARQKIDETRFALLLSEAGFKDITPYQPSDTRRKKEAELLRLEKQMRELQDWIDSLADCE